MSNNIPLVLLAAFLSVAAKALVAAEPQAAGATPPPPTDGPVQRFFPPDLWSPTSDPNSTALESNNGYIGNLRAMHEPPLFDATKGASNSVYRLLWLRTFHEPIAVRLTLTAGNSGLVHCVVLDGAGGFHPGKIKSEIDVSVGTNLVGQFLRALDDAEYWQRSLSENCLGSWVWNETQGTWYRDGPGVDGARWIIEGSVSNRYNIDERWSPKSGAFRRAALILIEMTGLVVDDIY